MSGVKATVDPSHIQQLSAENHAKLIEIRTAIMEGHEAKAALLLEESIENMSELTGEIGRL